MKKREIICGYGEILKHSLIADKFFYVFLEKMLKKFLILSHLFIEKAIYKSCNIKKIIVQKDEKEKKFEKSFKLWTYFCSYSYEATLGYSKKLNHGEAVILGMLSALKFSYKKKLINKKDFFFNK